VIFLIKFLSFYRKERKVLRNVPQSFFTLWSILQISREQEKMPGFTDSTLIVMKVKDSGLSLL